MNPLALNEPHFNVLHDEDMLELKLPGDPGWAEHVFELRKRQAKTLTDKGWKFIKRQGPRGTYFDAFNPHGLHAMTEQKQCEKAAFIAAIDQAFARQFPTA